MDTNNKVYFLYPEQLVVYKKPTNITTVLGSCVSVCLWDSKLNYGGMNHYLLPLWKVQGLRTPKFGNVAIELLIEKMIQNGSSSRDLVAKVFGGAKILGSSGSSVFNIGKKNGEIAIEILTRFKIRIAAKSIGGINGRKILFKTNTGEVFMKYIKNTTFK